MSVRRSALATALAMAILVPTGPPSRAGTGPYPTTPRDVVAVYCAADFGGAQTSSETWLMFVRFAAWPDAPGWDTFTVVSGYEVAPGGGARVRVVYHVLAVLEGEQAREERRDKTVLYRLVRRRGRWKVAAPQLEPHVSAQVALRILDGLEHNELVQPDIEKIRASRALLTALASPSPAP